MTEPKHPIQPLVMDQHGILRFKQNAIVRQLLDNSRSANGIGLNEIATLSFSEEDREQFHQLIGYSLSGYGDFGYSIESRNAALLMYETGKTETESRIEDLQERLAEARSQLKAIVTVLFDLDILNIDDF